MSRLIRYVTSPRIQRFNRVKNNSPELTFVGMSVGTSVGEDVGDDEGDWDSGNEKSSVNVVDGFVVSKFHRHQFKRYLQWMAQM